MSNGSSPRVRGTGGRLMCGDEIGRFIPACAGNGPAAFQSPATPPVHPRVCGERYRDSDIIILRDGSSPRVRGTVDYQAQGHIRVRFIPACAGNGWVK